MIEEYLALSMVDGRGCFLLLLFYYIVPFVALRVMMNVHYIHIPPGSMDGLHTRFIPCCQVVACLVRFSSVA